MNDALYLETLRADLADRIKDKQFHLAEARKELDYVSHADKEIERLMNLINMHK